MENQDRDLELLYEIGAFRFVRRTWEQFSYGQNMANDTEHSYRVAILAMIIAKHEGITDTGKVVTMGIIHDLPESRTGDVHYMSRGYTTRDEKKAMSDIFTGTIIEEDISNLWQEYEKRETLEAKIVKDADSLDVDLEMAEQALVGNKFKENFNHVREKGVYPKLHTETAKRIWKAIQKHNPHSWHLNGSNRYTDGDWKE